MTILEGLIRDDVRIQVEGYKIVLDFVKNRIICCNL